LPSIVCPALSGTANPRFKCIASIIFISRCAKEIKREMTRTAKGEVESWSCAGSNRKRKRCQNIDSGPSGSIASVHLLRDCARVPHQEIKHCGNSVVTHFDSRSSAISSIDQT
jgi:hypothetical protein